MSTTHANTSACSELIDQFRMILGDDGVLVNDQLLGRMSNAIPAQPVQTLTLVRPRTTQEVSQVLALCHRQGIAVVPQGGLTGLVHGADALPHEVALSTERMQAIEILDPAQRTLQVQAGVILQVAQNAARDEGLQLCVDLGSRGTATLGGMASTNAGGNKVISQGMMREQILGLEVVLADGTVVNSMNSLIKNNSGYDLKHLFIGSEGTLGVITQLVLRLHEAQHGHAVALLGVSDYEKVCHLLRHFDSQLAGGLAAFEVMWPDFYQCVTQDAPRAPLDSQAHAFYVLVEVRGSKQNAVVNLLEEALEDALDCDWVQDAVVAQSERECEEIWALRDNVARLAQHGLPIAYDISLKLRDTGPYIDATRQAIVQRWPSAHVWAFGHLGDGNVHLVVNVPGMSDVEHQALDALVYEPLRKLGGAISAEHGIGLEKMAWLSVSRSVAEISTMQMLKRTLDPKNILNPGRVIRS